jgi:hypothetical protein
VSGPRLGIVESCLPSPAKAAPSGPSWLRELKLHCIRTTALCNGAGENWIKISLVEEDLVEEDLVEEGPVVLAEPGSA